MRAPSTFLATALFTCGVSAIPQAHVGEPAPQLRLASVDGQGRLDDWAALRGQVVVVEFWATWCGPCVAAIPHMNELAAALRDEPIQFVSITNEARERVDRFLEKRNIRFETRLAFDDGNATFTAYAATPIPKTVIIGRDGKVVAVTTPDQVTAASLRAILQGETPELKAALYPGDADWDKALVAAAQDRGAALQVLLEPSSAGVPRTGSDPGHLRGDGLSMFHLLNWLCDVPHWQFECDVPEPEPVFWRISVYCPTASPAELTRLGLESVCARFDLRVTEKSVEKDVFVLRRSHDPEPQAFGPSKGGTSEGDVLEGKLKMTNTEMDLVVTFLAALAFDHVPVVNETGVRGKVDIALEWEADDSESLRKALDRCGFTCAPGKRPITVKVIEAEQGAPRAR